MRTLPPNVDIRNISNCSVIPKSAFCLQCWHVHSLHFRSRRAEHRSQQRRYRCGDRNRLSNLVIQAAATHLGRYGLTDRVTMAMAYGGKHRPMGIVLLGTDYTTDLTSVPRRTVSSGTIAQPASAPATPMLAGSDARERLRRGQQLASRRQHTGRCRQYRPTPSQHSPSGPGGRLCQQSRLRPGGHSCGR